MKKIKLLCLLLLITVTFYFGIGKVMALPVCDMKNNYGDIKITYRDTQSADFNAGLNRISYWCYNNGGTMFGAAGKNFCSKPETKFAIQYNISDKLHGKGGYIETAKFTIYNNENKPQCYIQYVPQSHDAIFQYDFNLNKKEVNYIVAEGSYNDGKNSVPFEKKTFNIGYKGDGSGNVHTTSTAKPNETTTTTTLKQNDINTTKDNGAAAGLETGKKETINSNISYSENACKEVSNIIREYWKYVMVLIPILLIVVMVLDFFKAVTSNDADAIKKASSNAVKRTISVVILLALPNLLIYIFDLLGIKICI